MICSGMAFAPGDSIFQLHEDSHLPSTSPNNAFSSSCAPQDFQGVSTLMMRRSMSFTAMERCDEGRGEDEMSDDGCGGLGEKKRRLNMEQVKALEKSFELGNKLEPERKMQLARALGLQPRQIAIWFQNRRARWKTKQLEKDYDLLKKQFEALKADNDALKSQNQKLHSQLMAIKNKEGSGVGAINLNKENNEGSWSNGSENSVDHSPPSGFPSSSIGPSTTSLTHLLQNTSRPLDLQCCPKMDDDQTAQDEGGFCNMFTGIEEQAPNFWSWPEHHQQHFH